MVRKLEGFGRLADFDRSLIEALGAQPVAVSAHTDIMREGDKPQGVLMIEAGMAFRYKMRANGARQISAYLVPGDLGDIDGSLLGGIDHGIATFSSCRIAWIKPETLTAIRRDRPGIDRALRLSSLVDAATLRAWLVNVGSRTAIERLAHLFCELLLRMHAVGQVTDNSYALPMSQGELGDTTGMSNVHVNRSLMDLRRRGLIHLKGKTLTILDVPALRSLAEFESNYLHQGEWGAA